MIFTDGCGSTCRRGQKRSERQARPPSPFMAEVRNRPRHKGKLSSLSIFSICLLIVASLPSAVQSTIICAHANSTCTNCRTLCGDAQFYPILPSFCHPESEANYSYSEMRPNSTGPSLQFTGTPISTPNDLLPTSIGESFSVSGYFKKNGANGTLMELLTNSNFTVSIVLLDDVLRVHLGTDPVMDISTIPIDGNWTHVAITLESSTESEQSTVKISLYIDNDEKGTSMESIDNFPTSILDIKAGDQYFGFLQDFGIYLPALNETELSQCQCYPNGIGNIDTPLCSDALESRYNVTPHVVDLLFDDSSDTYWQSEVNISPVNIQLHLSSVTNLSKIFITFESPLPPSAELDYLDPDSRWVPLQYWADNCTERFSMENDGIPSSATEAVCTSHSKSLNMDTLEFLIAAGNRTIPTDQQNLFSSNQLRLVMDGFAGASFYAIREFEVCTNFCTDTSSTCACTDSGSLVQSPSFSFESMSTSVFTFPYPESTSDVMEVAPTMTSASLAHSSSSSFESMTMSVSMSTDNAVITSQASVPTIHLVTSDIANTLDALVPSSTSASGFLSTVPSDFTVPHQTSVALSQSSMSFDSVSMPTTFVVTSQASIQPTSSYDATFQTSASSGYVIAASSISMSETESQMSTSVLNSASYTVVSSNMIQEEITSTLESIDVTPSATITSQQMSVDSTQLVSTPTTIYMSSHFNPGISTMVLASSSAQVPLEFSSTVTSSASQSVQFSATTEDVVQTSTGLLIPSPVVTTSRLAVDPSSRSLESSSIIGLDMTSISGVTSLLQESNIESTQIVSTPTSSSVNPVETTLMLPSTSVVLDSNGTNPSQSVLISTTTEGLATFETSSMFPTPLPTTTSTLVVGTFSSATGLDTFISSVAAESSPVQLSFSLSSFEAAVTATPTLVNSIVVQTSPLAPTITSITGQSSSTFLTDLATSSVLLSQSMSAVSSSPVMEPSVSLVGVNPTQSSSFDIVMPTSTLVASSQIPTALSPTVEPTSTISLLTSLEESLGTTFLMTVPSSIISSDTASTLEVPSSSLLQEQSMSPVVTSTSSVIMTSIEAIPSSLSPTVFQSSSTPFLTVIGPTSSVIEPSTVSIGLESLSTLLQVGSVMISNVVEPTSASSVIISDTMMPTIVPSSSVQEFEVPSSFSIPTLSLLSSFVTALPTTKIRSTDSLSITPTTTGVLSSVAPILTETISVSTFDVTPAVFDSSGISTSVSITTEVLTPSQPSIIIATVIPSINSTNEFMITETILPSSTPISSTEFASVIPSTSITPATLLTDTILPSETTFPSTTTVPIPTLVESNTGTLIIMQPSSTFVDSSSMITATETIFQSVVPSSVTGSVSLPSIPTPLPSFTQGVTVTFVASESSFILPFGSESLSEVLSTITPSQFLTTEMVSSSASLFTEIFSTTISPSTTLESSSVALSAASPTPQPSGSVSSTLQPVSSFLFTSASDTGIVVTPESTFMSFESSSTDVLLFTITPSFSATSEVETLLITSTLTQQEFSTTFITSTLVSETLSVSVFTTSFFPSITTQSTVPMPTLTQQVSSSFVFLVSETETPSATPFTVLLSTSVTLPEVSTETISQITPTLTQQESSSILFETPSLSVITTSLFPSITSQPTPSTESIFLPITPTLTQQESSSFVFLVSETVTPSVTPQVTPTLTQQESSSILFETSVITTSLFPSITSQPTPSTESIFLPLTPTLTQQESSSFVFLVSETVTPSVTPQVTPTLTQQESSSILFETSVITTSLFPSITSQPTPSTESIFLPITPTLTQQESSSFVFLVSETETPSATPFTMLFSPSVTLIPEVSTTPTLTQQESSTILFETPSLSVITTSLFPSITSQPTPSTESIFLPITPTLTQQESSSFVFLVSETETPSATPFTMLFSPSVTLIPEVSTTPTLTQQESSTILFETPSLSVITTSLFPSITSQPTPSTESIFLPITPTLIQQESSSFVFLVSETVTPSVTPQITPTLTQQESSSILFETPSLSVITTSLFPSITSQPTPSTESIFLPITPTLTQQESSSFVFLVSETVTPSVTPFTMLLSTSVTLIPEVSTEQITPTLTQQESSTILFETPSLSVITTSFFPSITSQPTPSTESIFLPITPTLTQQESSSFVFLVSETVTPSVTPQITPTTTQQESSTILFETPSLSVITTSLFPSITSQPTPSTESIFLPLTPTLTQQESSSFVFLVSETETPSVTPFTMLLSTSVTLIPEVSTEQITPTLTQQESSTILFETPSLSVITTSLFPSITSQPTPSTESIFLPITPTLTRQTSETLSVAPFTVSLTPSVRSLPTETPITSQLESSPLFSSSLEILTPELSSSFEIVTPSPFEITTTPASSPTPTFTPTPTVSVSLSTFSGVTPSFTTGVFTETLLVSPSVSLTFGTGSSDFVSSFVETFIPETTSFLSTAVLSSFQPSPTLISSTILQSSARSTPDVEPSSTLVLETTTAVILTTSTPLQLTESTIVATSFESSLVLSSTPVESSIVFETITSRLVITSTPAVFESSAIFIETTSILPTPTIEPTSSSPISSTLFSLSPSLSSPGVTSVITSQFSMSSTPVLSPSPTPPPQPPFAPLVVEIDGLGLLRQAVPVNQTESDGLHYEIDVGAYIGITEEDTMGSVKVSLGEFSGNSMPYHQEICPPFSIDVVLADDEVWSDKPDIVFAVQVRDCLLSTNTKISAVSAIVYKSTYHSTEAHSCYLDEESGVCNMTISLSDSWFTSSDESVNLTVSLNTTSTTKQVTLKSVNENTSSHIFMKVPSHSVFPGEIVNIPIYATYEYLLTSFTLNCSIDDSAFIRNFTGPETHAWSLITSFPNAASRHHYASVTGFRNYNADNVSKTGNIPDNLAILYVEIGNITAKTNISVQCEAVNLLLTTMISPETNIFVNATDREGVRSERGLLFAQPISAIKLFLHSEINQVINTAVLTNDTQSLRLTIQTFYSNGNLAPVTEKLTCESHDNVIKVNSNCLYAFFDGTENESGQRNITVQYDNASGSIPFRVWLPFDTLIEVDDDTLNKINNPCSENGTLYQRTKIHVVTNLSSTDMTPINSVYLTPVILPYLQSSNPSVLTINNTTGEILAHGPGEANITIPDGKEVTVSVNSTDVVDVLYLDVFIFSDISVKVPTANVTPTTSTTIEITLLQEFSRITSTVNVVGVAVFSDGQRMVLDEDMVDITALWNDSLDKIKVNMFSIAEEVNQVGFDVSWKYSNECSIKNKENNIVMFNSSIPQSIEIFTSSVKVALSSADSAHMVGIPDSVNFEVLLNYGNSEPPVPLNRNINISTDEEGSRLINITNNEITAAGMMTGIASIIAEYNGSIVLNSVTNITVVKGENLSVSAHPYPRYEGSRNNSITNIQKIGSSFQMVEIVTKLYLSDGSQHDITDHNDTTLTSDTDLKGNVLKISDNFDSDDIHIELMFYGLEGDLELSVTPSQLQINSLSNVTVPAIKSMQNCYQVYFDVIFEGGIHLDYVSSTDYPDLVEFYIENPTSSLSINNVTGKVHVISNHYQVISLCVRSIDNSVYNCTNFSANLQPQSTEIDLGNPTGLPLEEVNVEENFQVPVFLNLDFDLVSIFQIELTFNNELVRFLDIEQGNDWENGQIAYVNPTSDDDFISFGGILHGGVKGSQLNLANVSFISNGGTGIVNFSANVTFIAPTSVSEIDNALVEDVVSDASNIGLEITDVQQTVTRRAVGPYLGVEEPPLASPLLTADQRPEITRLRRKRQATSESNPVPGDANGDGRVDLRDVYLLQLYISESVFNFGSDFGQMLIDIIDEESLDIDGDGIITLFDVEEVEIVTLNLAYEAVLSVTVDYNNTIEKCSIEISGILRTISGNIPPDGINVHVVLGFSSSNEEFDRVFGDITFPPEVEKLSIPNQYGGIVNSEVSAPRDVVSPFSLVGTTDAISVDFNVTVAVIVTDLENSILFFSNDVHGLGEAESLLLTLESAIIPPTHVENILSNACIPTPPTTTSIAPSPSPSPSANTLQSTSMTILPSSSTANLSNTSTTLLLTPQPSSAVIPTIIPSSASQVTSSNVSTSQPVTSSLTNITASSQVTISTTPPLSSASQEMSTNVSTSQPASVSLSVSVPTSSQVTTTHSSTIEPPLVSSSTLPSNVPSTTESSALPSSTSPTSTESVVGSEQPSSSSSKLDLVPKPTKVSSLIPTPTQISTDTTNDPATTSSNSAVTVVVVLSVIIALLLVAIGACGAYVGLFMFRRKKGHYLIDQANGTHFRNSIASDGAYFQDAENCIEMSPRHGLTNIDIVPLEHYGSMMETSIDVVANYNVVTSDEPYGPTSQKPLINPNSPDRGPPKRGGPAPMGARQSMVYTETGTAQTGATMAGYTSSSMERSTDYDEDDEDGQLVLPEFEASQAYLSLGLTPLSQLSPDAHTSTEYGFFPSMPPPVAPSNSIFSTSTSSLAIDSSTFTLNSGGQSNGSLIDSSLMPDANPERRRRSKYDSTPLSQGFPLKLEPVMEQSPPVTGSQYSGKQDGFTSSEESSEGSPTVSRDQDRFMFPSAIATPEFSRLSQGRTAMRKRSGMKGGSKENLNVISPRGKNMPDYGSFGVSRHKPSLSPSQQAKLKRQKARENEIAKQKEESRRRRELEERERQHQQEQRMARTVREYHHSRQGSDSCFPSATLTNGLNLHETTNGFSTAETRFEAIEMMDRPYSRHASSTSIGSSSQSDEPSPRKWSRHSRHSSLDETPLGGAHRLQHSNSTHLYTTHEHM